MVNIGHIITHRKTSCFSKIGSKPTLEAVNIYEILERTFKYMKRRASKNISFNYPSPEKNPHITNINPPLFDWVLENLLKNALDALGGKGEISAEVFEDERYTYIDISDTGKGIPPGKLKTVFQRGCCRCGAISCFFMSDKHDRWCLSVHVACGSTLDENVIS